MKRFFSYSLALSVLLVVGCNDKSLQIPVTRIEFVPKIIKLLPEEEESILVNVYPSNATNLDKLTFSNSDPSVATFEDSKLLAKTPGVTLLTAECGSVRATASVLVYDGWFSKGGKKYGVDTATGYYYLTGEPDIQEMDITLNHTEDNGEEQHFRILFKYKYLNQNVDLTKVIDGAMVSVYLNNNEDGYCIYGNDEDKPVIKTADWSDPGPVTLTKGNFCISDKGQRLISFKADFALSNGYTFLADWEGVASMTKE